jgi:hypothetical protein
MKDESKSIYQLTFMFTLNASKKMSILGLFNFVLAANPATA